MAKCHKDDFTNIQARGLEPFKSGIVELVPTLSNAVNDITNWNQIKLLRVAVDHVTTWYKPGLICIGDSAHAMSPVGGVGINLAVQDAVAAANILVPAFRRGAPTIKDLEKIQARREFPSRMMQRFQVQMHRRLVEPVLKHTGSMRIPLFLRIMLATPLLRTIPSRIVGLGFRPEHIHIDF
jgi:2-polyprenyl-6-methoxyphenol hydroxylase-like FAD-dependent oxidoreductase